MYDYLIVGAGVAGCVLAERLAQRGFRIIVVEKRNHIGGNTFDEYNREGILIHRYGPHIFHTSSKAIWDYLSQFTDWYLFQHRVQAYVDGHLVPIPINLDTVNTLYNCNLTSDDLPGYLAKSVQKAGLINVTDARTMVISQVGEDLYNKLYLNYTYKQWQHWPEELSPEVTGRLPIRFNRDNRYFTDKYQGVPSNGYTRMFSQMLQHAQIHILLQTNYKDIIESIPFRQMIYTGPIDYFFDYLHGPLPYRSIYFEYETLPQEYHQSVGTINYPNDYDFTRITEYKHLTGQKHPYTTIAREFSQSEGEPFYPIPCPDNYELYKKYLQETQKLRNVHFIGRLAEYRYYSMDQVIERAFAWLAEHLI